MDQQPTYEQLTHIADALLAVQAGLEALPMPHPNRQVGRAYSLALTKTEEALMWLRVAETAILQAAPAPRATYTPGVTHTAHPTYTTQRSKDRP